jgi:hypothetical protein
MFFRKKCAQRLKISPEWRKFAQSGHTDWRAKIIFCLFFRARERVRCWSRWSAGHSSPAAPASSLEGRSSCSCCTRPKMTACTDPLKTVSAQGRSCPSGVDFLPWGWYSMFAPPFFLTVESVHPWGWTKGWTLPLGDWAKIRPKGDCLLWIVFQKLQK